MSLFFLYLWCKVYAYPVKKTKIIFLQLIQKQPSLPARNTNLVFIIWPHCITHSNLLLDWKHQSPNSVRLHLKCDGTCAETRFCLSSKRTSPFKSAGAFVLSTTGSRGVRISGSNAGYTMIQGGVKGGYPLHSPVSPSLPLPFATVCHHVSTGLYLLLVVFPV